MAIRLFGKLNSVLKVQFRKVIRGLFCDKLTINSMKTPFNKFLYIGFLILGLYQALFSKDYMEAAASLGIGLAFDPFDTEQKWNDRVRWQKIVLIIHLAMVALMFWFALC